MSIARQFLREFRPFFQILDEPFGRQLTHHNPGFSYPATRSLFGNDFNPFATFDNTLQSIARPAVDVSEEANRYVVEAELPGVKKEDVDVRIGDGGRSITIEGKIVRNGSQSLPVATSEASDVQAREGIDAASNAPAAAEGQTSQAVAQQDQSSNQQLSVERSFTGSSTFTRTVFLPRAVDAKNVSAKLADGVLTLSIPKMEDAGSVKVNVD